MDYMVLCACESFKNVHSIVFLCAKDVPKWPIDNLPFSDKRETISDEKVLNLFQNKVHEVVKLALKR